MAARMYKALKASLKELFDIMCDISYVSELYSDVYEFATKLILLQWKADRTIDS